MLLSDVDAPSGVSLIAGRALTGEGNAFTALSPGDQEPVGPPFHAIDEAQLDRAVAAAVEASGQPLDRSAIAHALTRAAELLEGSREEIVATADAETALGATRLGGELGRTIAQFQMMAAEATAGSRRDVVHDPAGDGPAAPELLRTRVPIGVVAVFAASNFPLAFGVAGTDTVAALAAGCPVVAKAHPAQPATAELCGRILSDAVSEAELHPGFVSVIHENGVDIGTALVTHDDIDAVAFTGSLRGGRALYDLAAGRDRPIPVYAEMGSLNPLFVSQGSAAARPDELVEGITGSFLLGEGQFCTKPGLVVLPQDQDGDRIREGLVRAVTDHTAGHPLLHPGIVAGFDAGLTSIPTTAGTTVHRAQIAGAGCAAAVITTTVADFLAQPALHDELFGPATVVLQADAAEFEQVLAAVEPALTGTVHFEPSEEAWAMAVAERLSRKVGRVIANGYPTGVRVSPAQHHGGPYPATTSPLHTSVGLAAIDRFQRPVAFQSFAPGALPAWVQSPS